MSWNDPIFRPFHYAKAHFKLFSAASQTSYRSRLQHLGWALFESIPILNYLVLFFDRLILKKPQSKPSPTTPLNNLQQQPSAAVIVPENKSPLKQKEINFPSDEEAAAALPQKPDDSAALKDKVAYSQALRRYMLYHNPYFEVNAKRKQSGWIYNYYSFCKDQSIQEFPLVKAVYSNHLKQVEAIISSPLFQGINTQYFYKQNRQGEQFDAFSKRSLLEHAIANEDIALFDLILAKGKRVDFNLTALLEAVQLGKKGEYYLEKILEKNGMPPDENIIAKAVENQVSPELVERLKARKQLHELDASGLNALHRACLKLDLEEVKRLVEKEHFYLEAKTSREVQPTWLRLESPLYLIGLEREMNENQDRQQQILQLLIDNGAICDGRTLFNVSTWGNPSWEEFALKMIENGANPFLSGIGHRSLPVRQILRRSGCDSALSNKIESLYPGSSQNLTNKLNLATLWEVQFYEGANSYAGGNWVNNTYALLNQTYDALKEPEFSEILQLFPVQNSEEQFKMSALLKQSIEYASQLLTRNDLDGIAKEIREKSDQFPVILPTSGNGHATAIIFWKNTIIQVNQGASHVNILGLDRDNPGIDLFAYDKNMLTDALICRVLDNPHVPKEYQTSELNKGLLIDFFAHNVDPNKKKIHHVDTPGQRVGNCAWSSSALLAFQVAMEAVKVDESPEKMVFSEEGKNFLEGFNTVARLLTVRNYLENIRLHQQDTHEVIESKGISKILRTCLVMLGEEDVKHPKLLEKIVSEILSSGLAIDCRDLYLHDEVSDMLMRKNKLTAKEACLSTAKQKFLSLLGLENYADAENLLVEAGEKEGFWHIAQP